MNIMVMMYGVKMTPITTFAYLVMIVNIMIFMIGHMIQILKLHQLYSVAEKVGLVLT